ncbi:MAG: hypothetical protein OXR66_00405 [Candidatus Woesearchaeota archaeon]|nr:hypothetical protein [Candidatus Woesearchaeota archaeon]
MKKIAILSVFFAVALVGSVVADSVTIRPDGAGAWKQWRHVGCSSGNNEWQCVDEVTLDTSDYLRTGGTRKETFTFGSTGLSTETVNSVTIHYVAMRHNNNKNRCFEAMTRSGGTDYLSGTQICTDNSWDEYTHVYTTNPATSAAWTVTEVDALEAGMRGLNPNNGGRVAQVWAVVDYTGGFCGDNETNGNETCDGTDFNGETCVSQGFDGGTLGCAVDCGSYDTSGCWTDSCSATDGSNIFVAGTTSGSTGGVPFSIDDVCISSTLLFESYCFGDTPLSFNTTCPPGNGTNTSMCVSGACV